VAFLLSLCCLARRQTWIGLVALMGLVAVAPPAQAQAPLQLVNDETSVGEISFRFVEGQSFDAERLRQQMATEAPGFVDRLRTWFAFLPALEAPAFPFDPVTLQKDVVRLRRFYRQNGFPSPSIDYPASQLDTARNAIHLILSVQEGDPIVIRNTAFRGPEGEDPVTARFSPSLQRAWTDFLQRTAPTPGERYTTFRQGQIESDVRAWLRDQGYAFASVSATAEIDSSALTADLQFNVNPGPVAHVSDIQIQGTESVDPSVALRELSFEAGDRFSASKVTSGQRQLFDLNLFRVALADVPEQAADSTVVVRYRVREADLRSYSGQVGYGTQSGITMEGSWRHRNFYGDARTLIVGLIADTGYPERPPGFVPNVLAGASNQDPTRRFRASATLRQPYVFTSQLSASVEPFVQERLNAKLSTAPLDRLGLALNERQYGVNTQLVYDFLPFRTLSFQHSFSRTRQFGTQEGPDDPDLIGSADDLFDRSVFSINGTFGKADDFINPTQGFIIRPALEVGGALFESGVEFVRLNSGMSGYLPLTDNIGVAGRLSGGVVLPFRESRTNLTVPSTAPPNALEANRTYQNRFSDYLFYAGGGSDIRGWTSQLAGGKVLRRSDVAGTDFVYEPTGGRSKIGVNLELRLPFPGLGSAWRTSVFLDGASLTPGPLTLLPPPSVSPNVVTDSDGERIASDPSRLLVGTGAGLRYKTPFGFLRLDLAYKLTPDYLDLRRPGAVGCAVATPDTPDPCAADRSARSVPARPIRRFRLHFGIGRSF
jgi:outer membrane protein insertion porin family